MTGNRANTGNAATTPSAANSVDTVLYADRHLRVSCTAGSSSVVLTGEVDVSNSAALASVLNQARDSHGEIEIDTAGLRFIDLAGLRALAAPGGRPGDRMRLRNVPPYMARLLEMLGPTPCP
ncbi:STAS domain-containing protein [Planotetraspora sp. GP83]|uniref:STAS domain-containing protein n=1 Tax=Planotetraspora sp. GP83 TaxID=3156264 RepID=UPI003516AB6B